MEDSIVDEVHRLREQYTARFNHDLKAVWADLQAATERAETEGRQVVSLPPRRCEPHPPQVNKAN